MNEACDKLKKTVKDLLSKEKIDLFIGYEQGTIPNRSRPSFVKQITEADRLVLDVYCSNNLAVYLPSVFQIVKKSESLPIVGIAAKACDIRSIVELIKEKQIPRENIIIVGVPCDGVADLNKLQEQKNIETDKNKDPILSVACLECDSSNLDKSDIIIKGELKKNKKATFREVKAFEKKPIEERWNYFKSEISKCIRCYACRQACPNCYCKVCFVDQSKPGWVDRGNDLSDVMLYQIGRIFHQAGRCVSCDACVRACPMGIDLRTFTQKLVKDAKELFQYTSGMSMDDTPLLCTFKQDDKQDFITEPKVGPEENS